MKKFITAVFCTALTTYQFIKESSVLFRNVALFELFANLNIILGINIEVIADLI